MSEIWMWIAFASWVAILLLIEAVRRLLKNEVGMMSDGTRIMGAARDLALAAGRLVTATDGIEPLRAERQDVLDNMWALADAISAPTPADPA